jgi:hypothetical protein
MPSIIYAGVKYKQIRHAIYCKKCMDTIESRNERDFKVCSCGSIGIDGGTSEGNHILGDWRDMENRGIYVAEVGGKRLWLPQGIMEQHFKSLQFVRLYKRL